MNTVILSAPGRRDLAKTMIDRAPDNAVVTIKEASRTPDQNALMWTLLTEVSRQEPQGRRLTPDDWKALFMHACGYEVQFLQGLDGRPFPQGFRSSHLSKEQMGQLIDFIQAYAAEQGVRFSFLDSGAAVTPEQAGGEHGAKTPPATVLGKFAQSMVRVVRGMIDDGSIAQTDEALKVLKSFAAEEAAGFSEDEKATARTIYAALANVVKQVQPMSQAIPYVAGLAKIREEDLA